MRILELVHLLEALGYRKHGTTWNWRHPERKVIFLGDFIDRGPKIREVLEIVRPMIEEGKGRSRSWAITNSMPWHFIRKNQIVRGLFFCKRDNKNIRQHGQTILQLSRV